MSDAAMPTSADAVAILRDLLRCASVTPLDAGALGVIETLLRGAGFTVHRLTFSEPGWPEAAPCNSPGSTRNATAHQPLLLRSCSRLMAMTMPEKYTVRNNRPPPT